MLDLDARLRIATAHWNSRGATVWRASLGWSTVSSASGVDVARATIRPVIRDHARGRGGRTGHHPEDQLSRNPGGAGCRTDARSEEHTSELQSRGHLVCRLLLEKKKYKHYQQDKHRDLSRQ